MAVSCLEIDDARRLIPCPAERAARLAPEPGRRLWLDLQGCEPGEVADWLERLRVSPLARRLCLEALDRPGFYPLREEVLLVFPLAAGELGMDDASYLACLCREDLLLTIQSRPGRELHRADMLRESESWLLESTIAGLVATLMMSLSLECLRHSAELGRATVDLGARMDRAPDGVRAEEVVARHAELLGAAAVLSDQLPVVRAMSETDKPFFRFEEARAYLSCALTNLQAAQARLGWLDQRLNEVRSALHMHAQDKMNHRLGTLTVLSAIFMPLTLLAGIWGMNFTAMPELQWPFGYALALGVMLLVGGMMYRFFRQGGWFR